MDSKNVFAEYLRKDASLKPEEIELICHYFQEEFLSRETPLLMAGSKYKKIVFVVEGVLRIFIVDNNGEEVVKNFLEPMSFFAEIESLEKNQNSHINVCAVTDCILLTLSKQDANKLINQFPRWEYLIQAGAMHAMNDMIYVRYGPCSRPYRSLFPGTFQGGSRCCNRFHA